MSERIFCWADDEVSVRGRNVGDAPIDTLNLTFLVDGIVAGGFTPDIDGETGVWHPGHYAYFNQSSGTEPERVVAVTAAGNAFPFLHIVCPVLTTIVVTPATAALDIGGTQEFAAVGYDQHGELFDGRPFSWSSDCGTTDVIDANHALFTAGTVSGTCLVTATSGLVSGSASVTIDPDEPVSIEVTPDPVGVPAGGTEAFVATARDAYGNVNATAPITWTTNAGSITSAGVLTAQTTAQLGRSVTATWTSLSDSAVVDVYAAAPSSITLSPTSAVVNTTLTQQFTATVRDAYGNLNTTAPVAWSATRGAVDANGLYTAPSTTGADTVTATSGSVSASASVSVQRAIHVESVTMYKANVTSTSFKRAVDTAEARVIVKDHLGNVVEAASVSIQWVKPNGQVDRTDTVSTTAAGEGRAYWAIPQGTNPGSWSARVSSIGGTDLWWDRSADLATAATFDVS